MVPNALTAKVSRLELDLPPTKTMFSLNEPKSKSSIEMIEKLEQGVEEDNTPIDTSRSKHIRRQFDRRVLPIVCCLYVLSYIDRGNIGNAKTAGAQTDLGLNSTQWAWCLMSFYICYIALEWTTMFWKLFPAHKYVAVLCLCWGAAAMCSGAARNMAELIVCRAFLGIFEAAFGAGAPYFLSLFYSRKELGFRMAFLLGMSPVANCFASSLAYGITHIRNSLEPWRLLFVIEGIPTVLFAPIVYFFLPDAPDKARFLKEDDQTLALERLETVDKTAKGKVSWKQVVSGLGDYQNYVHSLIHFCCNYSFASLSNFLPTIVNELGYSSVTAQGLTAPPYLVSFCCCVVAALISDRYGKRGWTVALASAVSGGGYLILALVQDQSKVKVRYAGVWLATCGIFPALAINVTWLLNNQQGHSKRGAGLALLLVIGQCSSFISSNLYPSTDAPYFVRGCAIGCGLTFLITIVSLMHHFGLEWQNKKRDRLYGPADESVRLDVTEDGDQNTNFRYLT